MVTSYLDAVQEYEPESHTDQERVLDSFVSWFNQTDIESVDELSTDLAVEFAEETNQWSKNKIAYLDGISKILAMALNRDPSGVRFQLLQHETESKVPELAHRPSPVQDAVKDLQLYLKREAFGTRVHAYVATLADSRRPVIAVRELNLEDVDLYQQTLRFPIDSDDLLVKAGLQKYGYENLSHHGFSALREYITNNRITPDDEGADEAPLFTTRYGRASQSTLTKHTKKAVEEAIESGNELSSIQEYVQKRGRQLLPKHISTASQRPDLDIRLETDLGDLSG